MRLGIITHLTHWTKDGKHWSRQDLVRQMDFCFAPWLEEIVMVVPFSRGDVPRGQLAYQSTNISIHPVRQVLGSGLRKRLTKVALLPAASLDIMRAISRTDAFFIRFPGPKGIQTLALLCSMFSRKPRLGIYLEQWDHYQGEPLGLRFVKWFLTSHLFKGYVVVLGEYAVFGPRALPTFSTNITKSEVEASRTFAVTKRLGGSPVRFVFVGRLSAMKGIETLLRAAKKLKEETDLEFLVDIVGGGELEKDLLVLSDGLGLSDIVRFMGHRSISDVWDFYKKAHIFVFPTLAEGWGRVLMEAMMYGLPCISTRISAIPEVIGNDERGLLVPPGDHIALAKAMLKLATDKELYLRQSRAARSWVVNYTLEDLSELTRNILEKAWGRPLKTQSKET